jgi:hypothetical protein
MITLWFDGTRNSRNCQSAQTCPELYPLPNHVPSMDWKTTLVENGKKKLSCLQDSNLRSRRNMISECWKFESYALTTPPKQLLLLLWNIQTHFGIYTVSIEQDSRLSMALRSEWGRLLGLTRVLRQRPTSLRPNYRENHHAPRYELIFALITFPRPGHQVSRATNTTSRSTAHPVTTHICRYSRHSAVSRAARSSYADPHMDHAICKSGTFVGQYFAIADLLGR